MLRADRAEQIDRVGTLAGLILQAFVRNYPSLVTDGQVTIGTNTYTQQQIARLVWDFAKVVADNRDPNVGPTVQPLPPDLP